jgi:hypothetical protein
MSSLRSLCIAGASVLLLGVVVSACTLDAGVSATLTPPPGCSPDSSIVCPGGGDGWVCGAGDNPEAEQGGLSCSIPQADGPNDDFCCFQWTYTSTTCTPDDTIQCDPFSYGYVCAAGDDPTTLDASLNCSVPTPAGPNDDFCCQ